MFKSALVLAVALSFSSLAFAGPAETPVPGKEAASLAASLKGLQLKCAPTDVADRADADFFPLTIMAQLPTGKALFTVATVHGEDGLSGCNCSRGTYRHGKLKLLDGDDDNYRDIVLTISAADAHPGAKVKGVFQDLNDNLRPWKVRPLLCEVRKN